MTFSATRAAAWRTVRDADERIWSGKPAGPQHRSNGFNDTRARNYLSGKLPMLNLPPPMA
jgi:hypothetical protein